MQDRALSSLSHSFLPFENLMQVAHKLHVYKTKKTTTCQQMFSPVSHGVCAFLQLSLFCSLFRCLLVAAIVVEKNAVVQKYCWVGAAQNQS